MLIQLLQLLVVLLLFHVHTRTHLFRSSKLQRHLLSYFSCCPIAISHIFSLVHLGLSSHSGTCFLHRTVYLLHVQTQDLPPDSAAALGSDFGGSGDVLDMVSCGGGGDEDVEEGGVRQVSSSALFALFGGTLAVDCPSLGFNVLPPVSPHQLFTAFFITVCHLSAKMCHAPAYKLVVLLLCRFFKNCFNVLTHEPSCLPMINFESRF